LPPFPRRLAHQSCGQHTSRNDLKNGHYLAPDVKPAKTSLAPVDLCFLSARANHHGTPTRIARF
jgi:hypothetical protein